MSAVIVSPHLDDAAFSASTKASSGGVTVLTVFTAAPPAGWPTSTWDLLTGAQSSHERMRERLREDEAALRLLGAGSTHLGEFEQDYRRTEPSIALMADRMTRSFADVDEVWLPAAIGGHRDHQLARDAALRAAALAGHEEVTLYADYPYIIQFGWPPSAVGRKVDPYLDADGWLHYELSNAGLDPAALTLAVTELDPAQRALKSQVIAAYQSQASAFRLAPHDLAADPSKLDFELSWRMDVP